MPPAAAAPVPESLLKKRKRNDAWAAQQAAEATAQKKAHKEKRAAMFKRAESYVKEYRDQERDLVRLRREARAKGAFYMEPGAKVLFVMRIRGACDLHPKTRTILRLLRLRQIQTGVFLRVNKPVLNMLKKVEPYITYGYPNLKTVKELIYKRGYGKVNGQRIPLTDNAVIEKVLGEHGIVCIEDLIHEITTAGPAFKQAANFLWPFKLSSPNGGYSKKRLHYIEGGEAGQRESAINAMARALAPNATSSPAPALSDDAWPVVVDGVEVCDFIGSFKTKAKDDVAVCRLLVEFGQALNYKGWKKKYGWFSRHTTYCTWHGVSCPYPSRDVIAIQLGDNNLQGTLPGSLGRLPKLTNLEINNNRGITGPLPPGLFDMKTMKHMQLSHNGLTGTVPDLFEKLPHLFGIALNDNQLTGTPPISMFFGSELTSINIGDNKFSGALPDFCGTGFAVRRGICDLGDGWDCPLPWCVLDPLGLTLPCDAKCRNV